MEDCIVVGAGAAGLSAGLALARRSTLVVDAGQQNNLAPPASAACPGTTDGRLPSITPSPARSSACRL
ncbi:FAD-binding protein [Actinoplanes sp. N902-109]|uniref:FAD-binding protein n=1 Tax=Actinoplanes sp. (strain N902-109) TaxID=649831 RepID=UPI0018DB7AA4|nr:FAD-binding protein [Actinoplanes sp. N902-109]